MALLQSPIVHGALIALVTAVAVDLHAWKSWGDVAFNFPTASFRWISSAVFGAVA